MQPAGWTVRAACGAAVIAATPATAGPLRPAKPPKAAVSVPALTVMAASRPRRIASPCSWLRLADQDRSNMAVIHQPAQEQT